MMSVRRCCVWLALFLIAPFVVQGQVTRNIAPPLCQINSNTRKMTMRFVAEMNTDEINYIAGCRLNQTSNEYGFEDCTYTTLLDNGETYFIIESIMDLDDTSDAASVNPCGVMTTVNTDGTLDFTYRIAFRRYFGFIMAGDSDYQYTCKRSEAIDTYLTTAFEAIYDTLVPVDVVNPSVTLTVTELNGISSTSCTVGEKRKLKIAMTNLATYQDHLTPYGIFASDALVGRTLPNVQGKVMTSSLTESDGCATTGNPLSLAEGFTYSQGDSTTQQAVYFSGEFTCRRYMSTNMLVFSTTIGFCRGQRTSLNNNQDKCHDNCAWSIVQGGVGRKKRSELDETQVYATLTIDEETYTPEEQASSNTMLVVIAVCVTLVVLALLVVFGCFMFYMSKKQHRNEKRGYPDASSNASSDRKLPIKF